MITMKVLLIQPPVEDFYQTTLRTLPVGLLYLAASLRCAGVEVEILDCQATLHRHVLELPPEFAYLKPYYQPGNVSPFKLFSHYRHYGLGWDEIRERIRQAHADVIDDLDALPLPARDLIDPARYTLGGKRVTMLITSRGCPYHCTFCSIFLTAGRRFRTRSLPSIIDEMKLCRERFGTHIFDIEDDNFSFDQKRAAAILTAIREEFGDQGVELLAMNGISAANV